MSDEIFTVAQAAEYLKVCNKTILRLIKSQKLTASKVCGHSWRIKKEDLIEYLSKTQNTL